MGLNKFGQSSRKEFSNKDHKNCKPVLLPFEFTRDGNIDCKSRKLCNVLAATNLLDAVNKEYVDKRFEDHEYEIIVIKERLDKTVEWISWLMNRLDPATQSDNQ